MANGTSLRSTRFQHYSFSTTINSFNKLDTDFFTLLNNETYKYENSLKKLILSYRFIYVNSSIVHTYMLRKRFTSYASSLNRPLFYNISKRSSHNFDIGIRHTCSLIIHLLALKKATGVSIYICNTNTTFIPYLCRRCTSLNLFPFHHFSGLQFLMVSTTKNSIHKKIIGPI